MTGIISLGYIPSQLIVWDNPALTVENIKVSEYLFRVGIFSGVLCYLAFLLLLISLFNLVSKLDVLTIISNTTLLDVYSPQQISAQVMTMWYGPSPLDSFTPKGIT